MRFRFRFPRIPLFRIWYSTTYTVLFLLVLVLTAVTPGDLVYQSVRKPRSVSGFNTNLANIFIVAGVYLLTGLLTAFIYASRLYTNRTILAAIPKFYVPVEEGEVGKKVRKLIEREWERSALIAWESRPRDLTAEIEALDPSVALEPIDTHHHSLPVLRRKTRTRDTAALLIDPHNPPWGTISHPGVNPGTASVAGGTTDLVSFGTVITELPHLIEARAVSLAPVDPMFVPRLVTEGATVVPDSRVVSLVQRPETVGLREYLMQLEAVGVIQSLDTAETFIWRYERARFSTTPSTKAEFDELMNLFAKLLNEMMPIDLNLADELLAHQDQTMHGIGITDEYDTSSTQDGSLHSDGSIFRTAMLDPDDGETSGNETASLSSVVRQTGFKDG